MNYVVGFISHDGTLGRTFFASNYDQVRSCVSLLCQENMEEENTHPHSEFWEDHCEWRTELGIYFVGGLENLE
jgi:hypothetical protein